jgi:hypothetical protein
MLHESAMTCSGTRSPQRNEPLYVTPAQAGVQDHSMREWIPTCAGMICGEPGPLPVLLEPLGAAFSGRPVRRAA